MFVVNGTSVIGASCPSAFLSHKAQGELCSRNQEALPTRIFMEWAFPSGGISVGRLYIFMLAALTVPVYPTGFGEKLGIDWRAAEFL